LEERLLEATWAYNNTWKTTTEFIPYDLVYGNKSLLSIEFEYNTLRMEAQLDLDVTTAHQERFIQLNGLDEDSATNVVRGLAFSLSRETINRVTTLPLGMIWGKSDKKFSVSTRKNFFLSKDNLA